MVERRIADAALPAQIARRHPASVLLQNLNDLLFREPAFTHRPSPQVENQPQLKTGAFHGNRSEASNSIFARAVSALTELGGLPKHSNERPLH